MDTVQLLMIGWAIQAKNVNWNAKKWKRPPKSSKIKMFVFGLHSTSHDRPIWSMDLNPICHPSPANKIKCSFLDYIQLLMICQAGQWTQTPSATPLQPKKWNAHFWITGRAGWFNPSPAKKMKCSFLDYIQLMMIGRVIQAKNVNRNVKKWKRPPKLSKNKMFVFGLRSTSDDWMSNPSKKCWPKCKKNPKKAP